jgi:hypothetical protein
MLADPRFDIQPIQQPTRRGPTPGRAAWGTRAGELAQRVWDHWVNRTDVWGGYRLRDGTWSAVTLPPPGRPGGALTPEILKRHFRAADGKDVIGLHSVAPGDTSKWGCVELDNHGDGDAAGANFAAAPAWARRLTDAGFHPLLTDSDGRGGLHLRVLVSSPVATARVRGLLLTLTDDHAAFGLAKRPEVFPKQDGLDGRKRGDPGFCGSWLRVPGRHPKRDHWSKVWDGERWLEGNEAIDAILALTGDDPTLINAFGPARAGADPPPAPRSGLNPPPGADPAGSAPGGDGGAREESWARRMLRAEVRRVESATEGERNDTLNVAAFTLGGLVGRDELTREEVEEALKSAAEVVGLEKDESLRTVKSGLDAGIKEPLERPADPPRIILGDEPSANGTGHGPNEPPADAPTGCQIILDHFRKHYRPVFRDGSAVHCAGGRVVPMNEACAVPDSRLIAKLAGANNAPRFKGGGANVNALPGFFRAWAKVAWGDLLRELPDEDQADLGALGDAREVFRRLVRDALLCEVTLSRTVKAGPRTEESRVERRTLIDWCRVFARPGPWRAIRGKKCWCKVVEIAGGELVLKVAVRQELFAQMRSDPLLIKMTPSTFTRRAQRYGLGTSEREDRPHGYTAVVLADDVVAELTGNPTTEEISDAPPAGGEHPA